MTKEEVIILAYTNQISFQATECEHIDVAYCDDLFKIIEMLLKDKLGKELYDLYMDFLYEDNFIDKDGKHVSTIVGFIKLAKEWKVL